MTTMMEHTSAAEIEGIVKLTVDMKAAARSLSEAEARYHVDTYYTIQEQRIRAAGQVRAFSESGQPHITVQWVLDQNVKFERYIKGVLDIYSKANPVGEWSRGVKGIGPVLAAGLLAHIDITKAPTVGHIWSFAGLNPEAHWGKGEKRPFNARLKTLCWKIGESFVKVSGRDDAFYGKVYVERKAREIELNEAGVFAEQAGRVVKDRPKHAQIKRYKEGKLPDGHIHMRAKRYAVKLFLSHWHFVAYEVEYREPPPKPYILTQEGGHAHFIAPPGWEA